MEWVKALDEREHAAPNPFVERWVVIINELAGNYPAQSKLAEALQMDYKQFREVYEFKKQVFNIDFLRNLIELERRVNPYFILFGIGPVFFEKLPAEIDKKLQSVMPKNEDSENSQVLEPDVAYTPLQKDPAWRKQLREQAAELLEQKRIISALTEYIEVLKSSKK